MSGNEPVTVTWECWNCKTTTSQRFFPAVDGDPRKTDPDPPKPWVTEVEEVEKNDELHSVKYHFCQSCAATRAEADREEETEDVTYADMDPLEALEQWQEQHLCGRCLHASVCRFAPDEVGADLLVTISKCSAHIPDVIHEES